MVICTVSHKVPRTVASQYWPGNCCYKRTLPMPNTGPMSLPSLSNKLSTSPQVSESSSRSTCMSVDDILSSSKSLCPSPPENSAKTWKWTWSLCLAQYWPVPNVIWQSHECNTEQASPLTIWCWKVGNAQSSSIYQLSPKHFYFYFFLTLIVIILFFFTFFWR